MEGSFSGGHETIRPEKREQPRHLEMACDTVSSPLHPDINEDTAHFSQEKGLFGVFDGIGGAPAGDIASRTASHQLTKSALEHAILDAESPEATEAATKVADSLLADADHPQKKQDVEQACKTVLKRMNAALSKLTENADLQSTFIAYAEKRLKRTFNMNDPIDRMRVKDAASDMGTTVTFGKIWTDEKNERQLTIAHIGDSAIYRLRDGAFEKLTTDDSFITPLVEMGLLPSEEAYARQSMGQPNPPDYTEQQISLHDIITNKKANRAMLGLAHHFLATKASITVNEIRHYVIQSMSGHPFDAIKPHLFTTAVRTGDVYIALTDGVIDNLTHTEIQGLVERKRNDPAQLTMLLKSYAAKRASEHHVRSKADDITAVAVHVT